MTAEAIREGFSRLRSGAEMTPLADAAVAAARATGSLGSTARAR